MEIGFTTEIVLATCLGNVAQDDGQIRFTSITAGDKYGISTGSSYTGPDYSGALDVPTTFPAAIQTNIPNAGGDYTIRVYNGPTCFEDVTLTVPEIDCNVCDLNTPTIVATCDNNGTPSDPSDDTFTYTIEVTGTGTGATYSISGDDSQTGLSYDVENGPFGPFPIAGGDLTITVTDVDNAGCEVVGAVTAPTTCSDACSITADGLANVSCAGSNAVTFDLTPMGSSIGATYNVSVSGGNATSITPTSGTYGATTTFTLNDGAAGGGDITVTLTDVDDNGCTLDVVVTDPGVPELTITALASCADENGTQVAPNTYYVEVSAITGGNGGPYEVTVAGAPTPITQTFDGSGSLFFGPFDHSGAGGAVQTVTATDSGAGASSCEATSSYEVPEVLCGINDGGQASGCFCAGPTTDPAIPTSFILAQSQPGTFQAGGNTGQVQQYVLVNEAGNIVAVNLTGLFEITTPGDYTPYALNYQLDESATLAPFLAVGQPIQPILDGVAGNGPLADACFAACNVDATVTYASCSCYSVGSTIFADLDNNGNYDPSDGEFGIENVTIELLDAGGMVIATTMTDANGDYYFGGLDPGMYSLNIPTPTTLYPISSTPTDDMDNGEDNDDNGTQANSGDPVTSPTFTLGGVDPEPSGGQETGSGGAQDDGDDLLGDMTQDFGFFAPVTVGDVAFFDLNDDGLQTVGELGVPGVTVTLLDENGNIVTMDLLGNDLTNVMTAGDGSYLFENLPPGTYSVQFDFSTITDPEFYTFTTPNAGGNDANDSDNSIVINPTTAQSDPTDFLLAGEQDLTLDVGIVCAIDVTVAEPSTICSTQAIDLTVDATITPASLGGTWSTPDGNGVFLDGTGATMTTAPSYAFGTAATYVPTPADAARGYVTLVLTTNDPATGPCAAVMAMVRIEILQVDCGSFYWDGND